MISSQLRDCSSVTNLKRTVSIFHHQSSSASMCWTGEHVRLDELTCICMIMFCFSWFLVLFWIYKFISIGRIYFLISLQYIGWKNFGSFVAGKRQCSSDQAVKEPTDDEYDEISLDLCRLKVNQLLLWMHLVTFDLQEIGPHQVTVECEEADVCMRDTWYSLGTTASNQVHNPLWLVDTNVILIFDWLFRVTSWPGNHSTLSKLSHSTSRWVLASD